MQLIPSVYNQLPTLVRTFANINCQLFPYLVYGQKNPVLQASLNTPPSPRAGVDLPISTWMTPTTEQNLLVD
jgi:hypothetical protein